MIESALGILAFVSVSLIVVVCLISLQAFRALDRIISSHDKQQERHKDQTDSMLDRFMAEDWQAYKTWRTVDTSVDVGGFIPPEEPEGFDEAELEVRLPR